MRISIDWLKQFVSIKENPSLLAEMLSMLGLEAEPVHDFSSLSGVVIGKVATAKKHPNADRLQLCTVNDGTATVNVVCGAPNVAAGQTVAFAQVGAVLPGEFIISKAKIRGEESRGMICSERELGISDEHEGIMVLPDKLKAGTAINAYFEDVYDALDLDITPNRPDGFSHYGVAREIALKTGRKLKELSIKKVTQKAQDIHDIATVKIANKEDCPRYMGAVLENVSVGPTPDWMVARLKAAGQRSINNIVDISNYVLLEMGHPTHIFDYDKIPSNTIGIRRVKNDRQITTLDEEKRKLSPQQLLITDGKKPIALAGIMGGLNSAVTEDTTTVFVESAYFDPVTIRKGSKELGLLTDASRRFERGADIQAAENALWQVISLIMELANGTMVPGIIDEYPGAVKVPRITMRRSELDLYAGCDISDQKVTGILNGLGVTNNKKKDHWVCTPPTYRPDLEREVDLLEEIIRVYGYDNIPAATHFSSTFSLADIDPEENLDQLRQLLCGFGYHECQSNSLQSIGWAKTRGRKPVPVLNPLSETMSHMRTDLLPGLLETIDFNIKNGSPDIYLFEIGNVFQQQKPGFKGIKETPIMGAVLHGHSASLTVHDQAKPVSLFTAMGHINSLFAALGASAPDFEPADSPGFTNAFNIIQGKQCFGLLGAVDRKFVTDLDLEIDDPVYSFHIDLDSLTALLDQQREFAPINPYPIVERDVDFVLSEEVETGAVSALIRGKNFPNLTAVFPLDIFRHESLGSRAKSVTFHFKFQNPNKTLEDKDVTSVIDKIKRLVSSEFNAKLRS